MPAPEESSALGFTYMNRMVPQNITTVRWAEQVEKTWHLPSAEGILKMVEMMKIEETRMQRKIILAKTMLITFMEISARLMLRQPRFHK